MSEEKSQEWKTELRKAIREELKSLTPSSDSQKSEDHSHDVSGIIDCPDCYPNLVKILPKVRSKLREERKDKHLKCVGCGLGVDEEEKECPWCGGTKATDESEEGWEFF